MLLSSWSEARKRAERAFEQARDELEKKVGERTADLSRSNEQFRNLVNTVGGIVWEADAKTFRFSFVGEQAERILGYSTERWLNESTFWKDHLHPADRDWAVDFCSNATAEKKDHDFEYRMIAADGRTVWLRDLVTVVVEGERAIKLRGVMIDITNQKRAEAALREQANLLDLTHDTVFVRDMNDVSPTGIAAPRNDMAGRAKRPSAASRTSSRKRPFPKPLARDKGGTTKDWAMGRGTGPHPSRWDFGYGSESMGAATR